MLKYKLMRSLISCALIITLCASLLVPALAVIPPLTDDDVKYVKLTDREDKVISVSQYFTQKDFVSKYNPKILNTVLTFRVQFTQPFAIKVYRLKDGAAIDKVSSQRDNSIVLEKGASGNPVSPNTFVGYLVGTYGSSKDVAFTETRKQVFQGYQGALPLKGVASTAPVNMDVYNTVYWDGLIQTPQGVVRYTDLQDDGLYPYVFVLQPTTDYTYEFRSFMGMLHDFTLAQEIAGYDPDMDPADYIGGDPVNVINGNLIWQYTDFEVYGSDNLSFKRIYNSQDDNIRSLGYGWRHSFDYQMNVKQLYVELRMPDGYMYSFNRNLDGSYSVPKNSGLSFRYTGSGFELITRDKTKYLYSEAGDIQSITFANGERQTFTYTNGKIFRVTNPSGYFDFIYTGDRLTSVKDNVGRIVTYTYNGTDLATFTNADKNTTANSTIYYNYDTNHNLLSVKDFNGNIYLENTYQNDRVVSQTLADQGTTTFNYDLPNMVTTITDPKNGIKKYYYDKYKKITAIEDVDGKEYRQYVDRQLLKSIDHLNNVTTYGYDSAGNRNLIAYPDGTSDNYVYNSLNLVTEKTKKNAQGVVVSKDTYVYDTKGNMTSYVDSRGYLGDTPDPLKHTWTFTYDSNNNMLTSKDPLGNITTYTYDTKGNKLSCTDPEGNITNFEYDPQGRLVKEIGPDVDPDPLKVKRAVTTYEYTTAGKLIKTTDAENGVTSFDVNGNGFDAGVRDPITPAGQWTTHTEYNKQNKPVSVRDAENHTTTYRYDKNGNLEIVTDAKGKSITYGYDEKGRMKSMKDARGYTWTYEYDNEGRMAATVDPLNNRTSTIYDKMGRAVETRTARQIKAINDGTITHGTTSQYDAMGRSVLTTDAYDKFIQSKYDPNGNLTDQWDKNNNLWHYNYDNNNRMTEAIDPLNFKTTYAYDKNGQVTKTTSPIGAIQNYYQQSVYDGMGRLIKSIDANGNVTTYEYDLLSRLVKTNFPDGGYTQNVYNANGWLTCSKTKLYKTDTQEAINSYTYNKNGQILTITDAMGGVIENTYDELGRTKTVSVTVDDNNTKAVTAYDYDDNGNQTKVQDAEGGITYYSYDELNRVKDLKDPNGNITKTTYDENGNVKTVTNPDVELGKGVITYEYDLLDRLTSYKDVEGYTFSFQYDNNGNKTRATDGRNNTTETKYDKLNRVTETIDPYGNTITTHYDADGRVDWMTNAEGAAKNAKTQYTYFPNGNVKTATNMLGKSTSFTYDSMNRVETITDAKGAVTKYTYTLIGKVETITDALGGVKAYAYDKLGRLTKETNELGKSTEFTYDKTDRVLSIKNPLGNTDRFTYDLLGRIKTVTDKNGNITTYKYDANGNIIETIDALGHSSYFGYDKMNRLNKVRLYRIDDQDVVNEEQITLYNYDKRGLVTKEVNAASKEIIYIYDGNGNMIQKTDADSNVTTFGYDKRNLVETINYAGVTGNKSVSFLYNKNGELTEMNDWNGKTTYALDLLGRITSANDHNSKTTSYGYDDVGNKTKMTYPDTTVVTYTYDLLRRMTNVADAESQNTTYAYDKASQITAMSYPNGWDETYEYDDAGQLLKTWNSDPSNKINKTIKYEYDYDKEGNVTREYRRGTGVGQTREEWIHQYDALNRLIQTDGKWGKTKTSYQFDSLGNLTFERTGNNKFTDYKYNNLNQQIKKIIDDKDTLINNLTTTDAVGYDMIIEPKTGVVYKDSYTYTFDNRGNLIKGVYDKKSRVDEQYTYDSTNRMVLGINDIGEMSEYKYNGLGFLVSNTMTVKKNAYGYHDIQITDPVPQGKKRTDVVNPPETPNGKKKDKMAPEDLITPELKKTSTVEKKFTLDYTSPLRDVIMEKETNGLDYRYTYGLQKVSTVILPIETGAGGIEQGGKVKLYYHQDRLGTTDYLTDNVKGKVTSYIDYDAWGAPIKKAILKLGVRELDLVTEYTGHPYDPVLGMYFAEARMYDAGDRRFASVDPVKGTAANPQTLAGYTYVTNNSLKYVDPLGLIYLEYNVPVTKKYFKTQVTELQDMLRELSYLDAKSTGTYGGATIGAVKLFQMNYGLEITGIVNNEVFMMVVMAYATAKIPNASTRQKFFEDYIFSLDSADMNYLINDEDRKPKTLWPETLKTTIPAVDYYPLFGCFPEYNSNLSKNAGKHLTQAMINLGISQKTDPVTGVVYYDLTTPIKNMLSINMPKFFDMRVPPRHDNMTRYSDPHYSKKATTLVTFNSLFTSGGDWDIKLKTSWEKQLPGVPFLHNSVKFYYDGNYMTPENLGGYTFSYFGSAVGFSLDFMKSAAAGLAKNDNMPETSDDIDYINAGARDFYKKYPNYEPTVT